MLKKVIMCLLMGCIAQADEIAWRIESIPSAIQQQMIDCSWKDDCPVVFEDLAYLTLLYWGFDEEEHVGHMIVHTHIAQEVVDIFKELYKYTFPIDRMQLVDIYNADDIASMEDNNTSAFCSREITNKPGIFSNHSYGIAIDINPLINPYVNKTLVLPEAGKAYLDRTQQVKGIITDDADNICYQAFAKRGWDWGGHWLSRKGYVDYQHFAKEIDLR